MVRAGLSDAARDTADAVARRSYGKLVAFLAGRTRDVAAAEDALSEAFASALASWPVSGCPTNPEAWLLSVARRKAIDASRRRATGERLAVELQVLSGVPEELSDIPDQRLALLFACAHPALDSSVRAPLMLQAVLGLDAKAIAAAFLVTPAAMGKRLVRAKQKIREAGIPFRVPERAELPPRLEAVLDAVYAAFSEDSREALYLARLVVELMPSEPEALGLLALLLHADARRLARRGPSGEYVPLSEQDTARWDWNAIREAEALILSAAAFRSPGRFQLEAALQSAHVHRRRTGEDNWADVVGLYDALLALAPSPVVALNRAVALAESEGPAAGLAALDAIAGLSEYQPYWAARASLLSGIGAADAAREAYARAIALESDPAVRAFLQRRSAGE